MKKISLKNLDTAGIQQLSREALKEVTGGWGCGPDEFMCTDGSCIPVSSVKDGTNDCSDGSDEGAGFCGCTLFINGNEAERVGNGTSENACWESCKQVCKATDGCSNVQAVYRNA
ncbi:hypothetical protein ECE50_018350 [Chitinophaga sp. Mgbs1]|uniref:Low-density lipoprotein receptor domain class A n=2 Tax=Chitinophaga solisilvae TaxID=1233460 RepID=A0A9Q5D985_9BACT|nr:hypothetical protein [Chitinophaga solisilvae]